MHTLVMIVHVLLVVILVGPAMLLPWVGERALRARDGEAVHAAGRKTMAFNALAAVAAGFGVLATVTSDEHSFSDPWLIIATTLYVIALGNGALVIPATLARIGKDLQDTQGQIDGEALEQHRGRLLALAGLNLVFYTAVIILMVWRP